jgi:O-antigen/teichoic acid export membrane protein
VGGYITTSLRLVRSSLYTDTVYLCLAAGVFALLGFLFWAVVARLYSPQAVGIGGTAVTSLILLAQASHLGLGYAMIRFIPQAGEDAPLLLSRSLVTVGVVALLLALIFVLTVPLWSQDLKGVLWASPGHAASFLAFAVLLTVLGFLRFVFTAYRRSIFVLALNLGVCALRIPVVVLLGALESTMAIIAGYGLAVPVVIMLAMFVFLRRCTGQSKLPLALDIWRLVPLAPFALSNLASHVLTLLAWQVLPLAVIALTGAEAAGFFYIGWAVVSLALIMIQQLSLSLFAEGSNNPNGFRSQIRGALIVGVGLSILFAVTVYFLGDVILLLFGREYVEQSRDSLKLLSAAMPLAAVTYIYLGAERVSGHMKQVVGVSAIVTAVMLGAIVVLIPRMGIVGAGYGVVAGYSVGALISLLLLYSMIKRSHHFMTMKQSTAP